MQIQRSLFPTFLEGQGLYVLGSNLDLLDTLGQWGLAVVGTRNPSPFARVEIEKQLRGLASHDTKKDPTHQKRVIVSGLALGVDAWAHKVAIDLKLPTVAVLGQGLASAVYPPENRVLAKAILNQGGLLVSQFTPGAPPQKYQFIRRNEWMAKHCAETWLVQAPMRSGALSTATFAVKYKKTLWVTPCFPGQPLWHGNQSLLSKGLGRALWSPEQLLKSQ